MWSAVDNARKAAGCVADGGDKGGRHSQRLLYVLRVLRNASAGGQYTVQQLLRVGVPSAAASIAEVLEGILPS